MIRKSLLIWLAIIPLAVLNGGLRERIIAPLIGEEYALPLSGILLCLMIFMLCFVFIPRIGKGTTKNYLTIGLLWIVLTVISEFGLGLLAGNSFAELIRAYDITTGILWLPVVLLTGISPWLTARMRKRI